MNYEIIQGDCLQTLATLPANSVQTCVTSPPYYGLRDYGHDGQIGLEETPEAFVAKLVEVFREVRRVLHPTGTIWVNLGDSYNAGRDGGHPGGKQQWKPEQEKYPVRSGANVPGLKPKDLIGIPWMVAFALRADGWYLRSEIIWCLSGGTWVYVRTQKGDMPMMIRDLVRLNPASVKLWNGEKWTQLLGMSKSARRGDELELVLRSGERISCTPTHKFPTRRGLSEASQLQVGDVIESCRLPEPESPLAPEHLTEEAAWFAGLYIAEGHRDDKIIYIAGHAKEIERLERVQRIAAAYGGSANVSINGNKMTIRVHGRMLHAILDMLVTGVGAKKKGFSPLVWRYSNNFLSSMLDGYLSGDGHWDAPNNRWRLGFTRNYNLERDFRTVCARLGLRLTLNMTHTAYDGGTVPTFRGEIRMERSGHRNEKDMGEVVEIRKARCREVYDLGVEDEPHLFALASGILTHNSKKAPMPESVTDRPTKAHEQLFLLAKSPHYYYDAEAIAEQASQPVGVAQLTGQHKRGHLQSLSSSHLGTNQGASTRNKRSVWTLGPESYSGAHFATMPTKLVEPCILAGTSAYGCCAKCGAPWARVVEHANDGTRQAGSERAVKMGHSAHGMTAMMRAGEARSAITTGWQPTCACNADVVPCTVLDPFSGASTTGLVALKFGRKYLGLELNADYIAMSHKRLLGVASQRTLFELNAAMQARGEGEA